MILSPTVAVVIDLNIFDLSPRSSEPAGKEILIAVLGTLSAPAATSADRENRVHNEFLKNLIFVNQQQSID
jgi:hypothetical protein